MATTVEMNQGAPAADTNDAQVIDILKTAVGEPDGKLSQTDSANINGVPQDSGSKPTETSSNSDPAQMQETITALKTEVEQLREKLKALDKETPKNEEKNKDGSTITVEHDPPAEITRVQEYQWRATKPQTLGKSGTAVLVAVGPRTRKLEIHDESEQSKEEATSVTSTKEQRDIPKKFAINSRRLLKSVARYTKQDISESSNVWVRPFKYLLHYEDEIRAGYKEVCERHERLVAKDQAADQQEGTNDEIAISSKDSTTKLDSSSKEASKDSTTKDAPSADQDVKKAGAATELEDAAKEKALWVCLMEFMNGDMRDIFEMRSRASENVLEEIEFENLSWLYKPGDLVYHKFLLGSKARHRAYRVLITTGGREILDTANRSEEPLGTYGEKFHDSFEDLNDRLNEYRNMRGKSKGRTPLVIDCLFFDSDGDDCGPRPRRFVISEYVGRRSIKTLDVVPVRFMSEWPSIKGQLVERGRLYLDAVRGAHRLYSGRGYPHKWLEMTQEEVRCEVVIDQRAGLSNVQKQNKRWESDIGGGVVANPTSCDERETFETAPCSSEICQDCTDVWSDEKLDLESRSQFIDSSEFVLYLSPDVVRKSEEHLMLLPIAVYAYALQARKWRAICIDDVEPLPDGGKDPFDDLVMHSAQKTLIQALVKNQIRQFDRSPDSTKGAKQPRNQSGTMDIIEGKGRGLIILLHGVPGVGKTSTAECVARSLRRPLFPVTCGDLGTAPETVANRLEEYFTLAQKWGCVLLLDEADVFLASRKPGDVKRNALVSVFLRVLEYYAGVLILTTNRVAEFDEAFRSRIHVSIYYPPLKKTSTEAIWSMNIKKLAEMDVDCDRKDLENFRDDFWKNTKSDDGKKRRWNGRQIKNAFQTALALANWDFLDNEKQTGETLLRPKVTSKHFEMVEVTSAHFDDYIDDAAGNQEGGAYAFQAQKEGYRKDDANPLDLSEAQWVKDNATPTKFNGSPALSRTTSSYQDANASDGYAAAGASMPSNMSWEQMQQLMQLMQQQSQQPQQTPNKAAGRSTGSRRQPRNGQGRAVDSDDE